MLRPMESEATTIARRLAEYVSGRSVTTMLLDAQAATAARTMYRQAAERHSQDELRLLHSGRELDSDKHAEAVWLLVQEAEQ